MRRLRQLGLAIALASAGLADAFAQQPRDVAPVLKPGSGGIAGVIRADDDKRPLRGAIVTLNHVDKTYGDTTITDERGQFSFLNVPAGRFVIGAEKEGFVPMKAGAARPGRAGIPIALAEGERRTDVQVALPRGAVLTGTVRMPDGEPAAGVPLWVQRVITTAAGRRYVDFYGSHDSGTDDRGVYRIYGLVEGDYIIQAVPEMHFMHTGAAAMLPTSAVDVQWARAQLQAAAAGARDKPQPPPERPMMSLAAVYFPNVVQRSAATVVSVGRGEVRAGLDLTFPMLRTYRVSGTLLSAVGEFKGLPEVFLVEASAIEGFGFGQEAQGTSFNFAGVAPGVYTLVAFVPDQRIFAMADVRVSDQDVHLTLSMQPGLTMSGKVTFAGKTPPPDPSRVRIGLSPASGGIMLEPVQGTLKPDGTFTVEGLVPGMYRLTANLGGAPGWSLLSAVSGGREMSVAPVEINANSAADGIAVTFTDRQTELTGRLQDAAGVAAADYFIIVFSTNERAWYERSRAIAQTRPASDGQFTVRNLPPGEYFLAAVTDVEPNEWFNPAFLRELVPAAIRLTLAEGERKVQNVQIK